MAASAASSSVGAVASVQFRPSVVDHVDLCPSAPRLGSLRRNNRPEPIVIVKQNSVVNKVDKPHTAAGRLGGGRREEVVVTSPPKSEPTGFLRRPVSLAATLPPLIEQALKRGASTESSGSSNTTGDPKPWSSRWQRPCMIFSCSIMLVLSLTFSVLYWNYTETLTKTVSKSVILDHWGKGSPTEEEITLHRLVDEPAKEEAAAERDSQELPASVDASFEQDVQPPPQNERRREVKEDRRRAGGRKRKKTGGDAYSNSPEGFFRANEETGKRIPGLRVSDEGGGEEEEDSASWRRGRKRGRKWGSRRRKRRKLFQGRQQRQEEDQEKV